MKIMMCGHHHENLVRTRKVPKQILWDLSLWQNLPQIFNLGANLSREKFVGRNLEQIKVEGCKCYVCVQRQLDANFALTAKNYSLRYSALRIILLVEVLSSTSHLRRWLHHVGYDLGRQDPGIY